MGFSDLGPDLDEIERELVRLMGEVPIPERGIYVQLRKVLEYLRLREVARHGEPESEKSRDSTRAASEITSSSAMMTRAASSRSIRVFIPRSWTALASSERVVPGPGSALRLRSRISVRGHVRSSWSPELGPSDSTRPAPSGRLLRQSSVPKA